jgi:hypothetical protein
MTRNLKNNKLSNNYESQKQNYESKKLRKHPAREVLDCMLTSAIKQMSCYKICIRVQYHRLSWSCN